MFLSPSSYDNSHICSCSSDKSVILWDVATGQITRKLRGHAGVSGVIFVCLFVFSVYITAVGLAQLLCSLFCSLYLLYLISEVKMLLLITESKLCTIQ